MRAQSTHLIVQFHLSIGMGWWSVWQLLHELECDTLIE